MRLFLKMIVADPTSNALFVSVRSLYNNLLEEWTIIIIYIFIVYVAGIYASSTEW